MKNGTVSGADPPRADLAQNFTGNGNNGNGNPKKI